MRKLIGIVAVTISILLTGCTIQLPAAQPVATASQVVAAQGGQPEYTDEELFTQTVEYLTDIKLTDAEIDQSLVVGWTVCQMFNDNAGSEEVALVLSDTLNQHNTGIESRFGKMVTASSAAAVHTLCPQHEEAWD